MNPKDHHMPEGHEIRYAGKRRTGSRCEVTGELHTIYQLIGEKPCVCGNANVVTPEPES